MEEILFCKGGGCTAKLGAGALHRVLSKLPKKKDPNLLVGFESSDDAAVYRISDELAVVETLDFFPPMVEDPYLFGQIAAANALSDIYAMGGEVKTALNIVCFPETMDLNILGKILQGGNEKILEAGGSLAGGHSIADSDVKYGLSVTGLVHPDHILSNCGGEENDVLILTKPLGVGIVCTAMRVNAASEAAQQAAFASMTTLNKYAAEILKRYRIHACTDVTGFGFLVHLSEMLGTELSAVVESSRIPYIKECRAYAEEFYLTAAGQKNRNFCGKTVEFEQKDFAMEEILFDPQTSGGLLAAVAPEDAEAALAELQSAGIHAETVGTMIKRRDDGVLISVVGAQEKKEG